MRQRIDFGCFVQIRIVDLGDAGQRVSAANVHRARTADALSARTTERKRWIDFILDLDQRVQHHRTARVEIDLIGLHVRLGIALRILRNNKTIESGRCGLEV